MLVSSTIKLIAGSSHPELAELVAQKLGISVCCVDGVKLKNTELCVLFGESFRGADVFILQTGHGHINDFVMEMLIMIHACRKASAGRITAVMPLFPYARQDRKDKGRAPITAKLMADMLEAAGCDHVVTMDLHAPQIQGFFSVPVDDLVAQPSVESWIRNHVDLRQAVVVSPDAGGAKRAANLADHLDLELALIHKERQRTNEVSNMVLVGVVANKTCILIDDMADTCGTLAKAADTLIQHGATRVLAIVTHGIFSKDAKQKIEKSKLDMVVCTNSVPLREPVASCPKISQIDLSPTIAEAIRRLHNGESVSYLLTHQPL